MSFLKSAINQVGRDMGRVVSNQIFNNSHSTLYRSATQNKGLLYSNLKSNFDKAMDFQTGHRAITLIAKTSGVYTVIKNEARKFIADGYLDTTESSSLFEMMNKFNMKIDDVCDVLEIDEQSNKKEINQLVTIVEKTNVLFKKTLEISAKGCKERQSEYEIQACNTEKPKFWKYVGFHIIWMGNYSRGAEISIWKTVFANILDIITFTFTITRVFLLLKALFTFPTESKRLKTLKKTYLKLAELEGKRSDYYLSIV